MNEKVQTIDLSFKVSRELKKVYFNNKKHRIVYETIKDKVIIYIVAIEKREEMDVYKKAKTAIF